MLCGKCVAIDVQLRLVVTKPRHCDNMCKSLDILCNIFLLFTNICNYLN